MKNSDEEKLRSLSLHKTFQLSYKAPWKYLKQSELLSAGCSSHLENMKLAAMQQGRHHKRVLEERSN